jgi:hypothetical protein
MALVRDGGADDRGAVDGGHHAPDGPVLGPYLVNPTRCPTSLGDARRNLSRWLESGSGSDTDPARHDEANRAPPQALAIGDPLVEGVRKIFGYPPKGHIGSDPGRWVGQRPPIRGRMTHCGLQGFSSPLRGSRYFPGVRPRSPTVGHRVSHAKRRLRKVDIRTAPKPQQPARLLAGEWTWGRTTDGWGDAAQRRGSGYRSSDDGRPKSARIKTAPSLFCP